MDQAALLQLKTSEGEKFDKSKTMQQILDDAAVQLKGYLKDLKEVDQKNFTISAFVVLSVGSRRLLWEKVDTVNE